MPQTLPPTPSTQVVIVPSAGKKGGALLEVCQDDFNNKVHDATPTSTSDDIGAPLQVVVHPGLVRLLRRLWLQVCIVQDGTTGRDKLARFVQYLSRFLNGATGVEVFANLNASLSLARKITRFARPLKWARDMELCWRHTEDKLDKVTTLVELGSYFIYCCVDHCCFAQRIGFIPWGPGSSDIRTDRLDRFAELFWLTEVVPVFVREIRAYSTGGGAERDSQAWRERRRVATLRLMKAACDFPCSIYFLWSFARRNKREHKVWCGILGAIASCISLHTLWPSDKSLQDD
mmetsp:Transcript_5938/g.14207  ORF Transcript_5938/g.14207 Transcript_5938/m.14207 type:complete len:289 (+) Transcript_5938:98-964(+)